MDSQNVLQVESPADDSNLYDVVILGGGPAGVAAAVYTARKKLRTLILTESFGGQSIASDDVQNWVGEAHISGIDLAKRLEEHIRSYPDTVTIKIGEMASSIVNVPCQIKDRICDFEVKTNLGNIFKGKVIIVATGARRKKLQIPGEDNFVGKGVAYCSTCDAPLYRGKKVVVVGAGNTGLEAVHDLLQYADEVTLMESGDKVRGDETTLEEIKQNPKFKGLIINAETKEVLGDSVVSGVKYLEGNEEKVLEVDGIFVEIGSVPNSDVVKGLVQTDENGQITINFQFARTSHPGIFAAGDVTNDPFKQNNIAVGDGVRAALSAYSYIMNKVKYSPASDTHNGI